MDEARAFGRAMKAVERVRGWVGEACEETWAQLAMGPPPGGLAQALRALGRAAAKLASVDRERAIEEAEIAAAAESAGGGDAALIAGLPARLRRAQAEAQDAPAQTVEPAEERRVSAVERARERGRCRQSRPTSRSSSASSARTDA
jgi:hypothetical protein